MECGVATVRMKTRYRGSVPIAKFKKVYILGDSETLQVIEKSLLGFRVCCTDAPIHAERHRDQAFPHDPVGYCEERSDASDPSIALGIKIASLVSKRFFNDASPANQLKKGRARLLKYELIPGFSDLRREGADLRR